MPPPAVMPLAPIVYPDSDGKPMAENTLQYQWIVAVRENIALMYSDRADVLVAADNLVYPVEDNPRLCTAPDVYVAFGRPAGHRSSYKVWEEGDTFPQVIFEVLSPSNTQREMDAKREFYLEYGAEEYYVIDPDLNGVSIRVRKRRRLPEVNDPEAFVSPRLGIRFRWEPDGELTILRPDGSPFQSFLELERARVEAELRAKSEQRRADKEKRRADALQLERDSERAEKEKLKAKLRELGLDPDAV